VIVLAALVLVAGCTGFQLWRVRSVDVLLRDRKLAKVVVELHSGETFQGVLASCDSKSVVLSSVSALNGPEALPTKIDGDLLIPRGDVKFLQRP
jgi:small nuclear ribonucleoprotein (snRNP)-like protein